MSEITVTTHKKRTVIKNVKRILIEKDNGTTFWFKPEDVMEMSIEVDLKTESVYNGKQHNKGV